MAAHLLNMSDRTQPERYTADEVLERQSRKQLVAIHHVRKFWAKGCHCSICGSVDRRFEKLVTWTPDQRSTEQPRLFVARAGFPR